MAVKDSNSRGVQGARSPSLGCMLGPCGCVCDALVQPSGRDGVELSDALSPRTLTAVLGDSRMSLRCNCRVIARQKVSNRLTVHYSAA